MCFVEGFDVKYIYCELNDQVGGLESDCLLFLLEAVPVFVLAEADIELAGNDAVAGGRADEMIFEGHWLVSACSEV